MDSLDGANYPSTKVLGHKHYAYSAFWSHIPSYFGTWTLGAVHFQSAAAVWIKYRNGRVWMPYYERMRAEIKFSSWVVGSPFSSNMLP